MRIDVIDQPAVEPVSMPDIWDWLMLTPSADSPSVTPFDGRLRGMIQSAREECEAATNRAFVRQTLKLTLERFPRLAFAYYGGAYVMDHSSWPRNDSAVRHRVIELPRPPLISVVAVQYYDLDNVLQTADPSTYMVMSGGMPAQLQPLNNAWPDTYLREDAVQITYLAGYEGSGSPTDPTDTSNIPASIKEAVKLTVEREFNPMSIEQRAQLDASIRAKLARYKVFTL